jgi:predicted RND superfamily exporter protein
LVDAVLARRPWVLAGALLVALAALAGLLRLETDNSPAVYFERHDPALGAYRAARADFGPDAALRVVVRGPALWSEAGSGALARWQSALARTAGVAQVAGPVGRHPGLTGEALRAALLADPLDRDLGLVDPAASAVTLLVELDGGIRHPATLRALRAAIGDPPAGLDVELVGFPVLEQALDRSTREIYGLFFPLLVLVSTLLLALVFRSLAGVLVPLLFVALCELSLLGIMGWTGVPLNLVLAILPPLVFTVALATAVHMVTRTRALREAGLAPRDAVAAAYRDKGRALLWTAASTCAGFGSLATSAVEPVRALGAWAALGTALLGLFSFLVLPALLLHVGSGERAARRPLEAMFQRLGTVVAEGALRRRVTVYVLLAVVALAALAGLPRLRVEANALRYLPADDPARSGIERLQAQGVGVAALELIARPPSGEGFASGAALQRLSWIAVRLREETAALGVLGPGDLVEAALRASPEGRGAAGSAEPRQAALAAMEQDPAARSRLRRLLTADGRAARFVLFVETAGYEELDATMEGALAVVREEEPAIAWEATGEYPLLISAQRALLATLGSSLGATLFSIVVILFLLLRSLRATVLASIPNVFPVLVVLGAMGWLRVPLDIATVMVAATTLGLALDDTIHTLAHYRDPESRGGGPGAVLDTVERNAAAYSITGLVLTLGFAVCALSSFVPIFRFGTLSAVAIALAVACDFLLVPALLGGERRRAGPEGPAR